MSSDIDASIWVKKGATLSNTSAQKEFGLTFDEIVAGIRAGKLQYRENNIYGNPFLRLIRQEVEALVNEKYGKDYLYLLNKLGYGQAVAQHRPRLSSRARCSTSVAIGRIWLVPEIRS